MVDTRYIVDEFGRALKIEDIPNLNKANSYLKLYKKRLLSNFKLIGNLYEHKASLKDDPNEPTTKNEMKFRLLKWLNISIDSVTEQQEKELRQLKIEHKSLKSTISANKLLEYNKDTDSSPESNRMKALLIYALSQLEKEQPNMELVTAILRQARDSDD